ncbi:MAG: hypothetical protein GY716_12425 [bacterium]|nr:hypothetical protein [bacterium]
MSLSTLPTDPAASAELLAPLLNATGAELDRVLTGTPQNLLEARRWIVSELGFEPEAEILQTLVKIAANPWAEKRLDPVVRHLAALHMLAQRELSAFWDSTEWPSCHAEAYPALLQQSQEAEAKLEALLTQTEALEKADLALLQNVLSVFSVPRERLEATMLLAPELGRLRQAALAGRLAEHAPRLGAADLALLRGELDGDDALAERLRVVAMRSVIFSDLALDQKTITADERTQRLERDRDTYQVLAAHLQVAQDSALQQGNDPLSQAVSGIQREVFSVYLKLTTALRGGDPQAGAQPSATELESLRARVAAAEQEAQKVRSESVDPEQVVLDALTGMKDRRTRPAETMPDGYEQLQRERKTRFVLVAVAGALAVGVLVSFLLRTQSSGAIEVTPADFSIMAVSEAKPVGKMLYTRVTGWSELALPERMDRVQEMGRLAAAKGFRLVYVVDHVGENVAVWSRQNGARLVGEPGAPGSAAGAGS